MCRAKGLPADTVATAPGIPESRESLSNSHVRLGQASCHSPEWERCVSWALGPSPLCTPDTWWGWGGGLSAASFTPELLLLLDVGPATTCPELPGPTGARAALCVLSGRLGSALPGSQSDGPGVGPRCSTGLSPTPRCFRCTRLPSSFT